MIAATPAGGMVSLEDALADFTLPEFTCLPSDPVATPLDWVNMAFQFRRSHLTKPEPTVTLVDAVEGRSLEVPARAVHKMEYPEAVTYTHDPWANKDVCNLCGVYVSDQAKHTAWHGRAVRLMDNDTQTVTAILSDMNIPASVLLPVSQRKMVTMPELKLFKCVARMEDGKPKGNMIGGRPGKDHVWVHKSCVNDREKLLVGALLSLTQVSREPLKSNYTLRSLWVDAHNDWQYAHDLVAQFDAEEHQ
jgi:hypothetical protein